MKAITTKDLGPTDTKPARIVATDSDNNRVTVKYYDGPIERYEDAHTRAALALAKKMQWTGTLARGGVRGGYVFVWIDERDTITAS